MLEHQFGNADLFVKTNHSDYFRFNSNYTRVQICLVEQLSKMLGLFTVCLCLNVPDRLLLLYLDYIDTQAGGGKWEPL